MPDIAPLAASELPTALGLLLAPPGREPASARQQVRPVLAYLNSGLVTWRAWRIGPLEQPDALVLVLLLPGRTATVMLPTPGENGIDPGALQHLLRAVLEDLQDDKLHYTQALLRPDAPEQRDLLLQLGFVHLAPLVYLERDATYPWIEPPDPTRVAWQAYTSYREREFRSVVAATYETSLDCPELTRLRPVQDALAAHRASGPFDPALWELACIEGRPTACLLMSTAMYTSAVEIVYMGVHPNVRGTGIGDLILQRALEHTRRKRARKLMLVVDDRNEPAKRLYARFDLRPVARRDAYLYRWSNAD